LRGDKGFKQIINPVSHHPSAGVLFLRSEIPSIEFGGEHLLSRHASLIEGHPTVWPDGIFA
jgi:hypothetical protein